MKKILLFTFYVLMATIVFGQSNDPIPSFNVFVQGNESFTDNSTISNNGTQPLNYEKRDMNVSNDGAGTVPNKGGGGGSIIVVIYRLDNSISLGPYVVPAQQNLNVPIDKKSWGVQSSQISPTYVSVWTDNGDNGQ